MAGSILAPDDSFQVFSRPRAWLALLLLGAMSGACLCLLTVGLWRLDPAILTETGMRIVLFLLVLLTGGLLFAGWRLRGRSFVVLTADALGVWVGRWGRRQVWADLDVIRLRKAPGDIAGQLRFLSFEQRPGVASPLGRRIDKMMQARMIDLWSITCDQSDVLAGLSQAARAGGYQLIAQDDTTWKVTPI